MPKKTKLLKMNKKAQVADTTTWIIATVIIIVVLAISIFVGTALASSAGIPFYYDQIKDPIATKSIIGLLVSGKENKEDEMKRILTLFPTYTGADGFLFFQPTYLNKQYKWNFWLYETDKEKIKITCSDRIGNDIMKTEINKQNTKLKFSFNEC